MLVRFTKMHGLGNDFVVIDQISQRCSLQEDHYRQLADRHFGVGCDQVLIVAPPSAPDVDFNYRIFNPDGSEAEQCGNGLRCFAKYVSDNQLTAKKSIKIKTRNGIQKVSITDKKLYRAQMGRPELLPENIPFSAAEQASVYTIEANNRSYELGAVSMGNPHAVLVVDAVATADVETIGPLLESHSVFPNRVNVGFMEIVSRKEIKLRVFERGAGETLACGSGACAAVVSGRVRDLLDSRVKVNLPGGQLTIEWRGDNHPVIMTGPATTVYEGKIQL